MQRNSLKRLEEAGGTSEPHRFLSRLAASFRGDAVRADRAEPALGHAYAILADFEKSMRGWFWEVDASGRITYLTARIAAEIGIDAAGNDAIDFVSLLQDGTPEQSTNAPDRTLGFHFKARTAFTEISVRSARQDNVWWSLSGNPVFDDHGRFAGFRGSGSDLTEARRADAEITRLAHYDALTGLPNRLLMHSTLQDMLRVKVKRQSDCALFMLDLDRFKNVNDTLGHPVGDILLQQVAQRLSRVVGTEGQVCRLGGDEFTVVIPHIEGREELVALAESIIARLSFPYTINGSTISIGTSVGIAISPFDGDCPDDLVRNADLALYAAKAAGKGTHRFYLPQMHAEAKDRRLLEIDLREALNRGEIDVAYQPVIDVQTNRICAFEALVRWQHPSRGPIVPNIFVPIAEEIGIIATIGEWVLRTATKTAAHWPEDIRVAVNISPLQFANPSMPAIVANAIAAAGIAPGRLELELTEGVFLTESTAIDNVFGALKSLGVRLALDDFGIGYASLANLKRLPFDTIKIDQSFVRGLAATEEPDVRFIRAIVALADSLGMTTTAEGAETVGEVELIRSLGCSQIQGFIFGKPMTATEAGNQLVAQPLPSDESREREARIAVLLRGKLHSGGRTHSIRVRNISSGGAIIEIAKDARIDSVVELQISANECFAANVRWIKGNRIGLAFASPIDISTVIRPEAGEKPVESESD